MSWQCCLNGAMELRVSVKLWTVTETGFSRTKLGWSYCEEQLLHWKMWGFPLAPCSASIHWKAILLVWLDGFFFSLHKRMILPWHSVLCCFFPEDTTYYASWITCSNGGQLFQKTCWQMSMLFIFGESQQKAVCYLGCFLAYFISNPSVCINGICCASTWPDISKRAACVRCLYF